MPTAGGFTVFYHETEAGVVDCGLEGANPSRSPRKVVACVERPGPLVAAPQATTTPLFSILLAQKGFHGRVQRLGNPRCGERVAHESAMLLETVGSRVHPGRDLLGLGCEVNQLHV